MKRVAVALLLAALPFTGTLLYLWIWGDYYMPDRYEDAFQALAIAGLASVMILFAAAAFGVASYRRRFRRK